MRRTARILTLLLRSAGRLYLLNLRSRLLRESLNLRSLARKIKAGRPSLKRRKESIMTKVKVRDDPKRTTISSPSSRPVDQEGKTSEENMDKIPLPEETEEVEEGLPSSTEELTGIGHEELVQVCGDLSCFPCDLWSIWTKGRIPRSTDVEKAAAGEMVAKIVEKYDWQKWISLEMGAFLVFLKIYGGRYVADIAAHPRKKNAPDDRRQAGVREDDPSKAPGPGVAAPEDFRP
jgi:hypothetical protein